MTTIVPIAEARQTLPTLVSRAQKLMDRFIIIRQGKPAAVLMSVEEYEGWIETLELVSDPAAVAGIRQGLADLKAGRARSFAKVFREPLHGTRQRR